MYIWMKTNPCEHSTQNKLTTEKKKKKKREAYCLPPSLMSPLWLTFILPLPAEQPHSGGGTGSD